jgi:hypothetical protein
MITWGTLALIFAPVAAIVLGAVSGFALFWAWRLCANLVGRVRLVDPMLFSGVAHADVAAIALLEVAREHDLYATLIDLARDGQRDDFFFLLASSGGDGASPASDEECWDLARRAARLSATRRRLKDAV